MADKELYARLLDADRTITSLLDLLLDVREGSAGIDPRRPGHMQIEVTLETWDAIKEAIR
jgi:hypothetical protein